jgi:hypothetical protein
MLLATRRASSIASQQTPLRVGKVSRCELISSRAQSAVGNTEMANRERILDTQAGTGRMEAEGSGSHNRDTRSCGNSVVAH